MTCGGKASSANSSGLRTKMLRAKIAGRPVGANNMQTFVNYKALDKNDRLNIKLFGSNPVLLNGTTVNPNYAGCCNGPPAQPSALALCAGVSISTCQASYCNRHQY